MANRVEAAIERYRAKIKALDGVGLNGTPIDAAFEEKQALTFEEHFQYQTLQSHAFASGKLSFAEAQTIYLALGESMSANNGGWRPHVDLAAKIAITQLMGELANLQVR